MTLDSRYPHILNNFLHDMATGTWVACALVIWLLAGRRTGMPAEAADALSDAMRSLFTLSLVSLVTIGATGGVRLGYWRRETAAAEVRTKRTALIVKHVAFLVVYGLGTVWLWSLVAS